VSSIPQKPSRAQIYGQVQNLRYWGLSQPLCRMPDIAWLCRLVACFSVRPFWRKRADYSLAQNRRGSLVKLAKVDGHPQYTDERIAALCLEAIAAKGPPYVERITQRISREDQIREAKIPWALKCAQPMTLPIKDSLIEAAYKYVPSDVRTKPGLSREKS
jgi:hypothetical protein